MTYVIHTQSICELIKESTKKEPGPKRKSDFRLTVHLPKYLTLFG